MRGNTTAPPSGVALMGGRASTTLSIGLTANVVSTFPSGLYRKTRVSAPSVSVIATRNRPSGNPSPAPIETPPGYVGYVGSAVPLARNRYDAAVNRPPTNENL